MSLMCSMDKKCTETKGMCIHEKMMALFVMVGAIAQRDTLHFIGSELVENNNELHKEIL